jgi:hypothetical protein
MALLFVFLIVAGFAQAPVCVVLETDAGEIDAEVDSARAPVTSANVLNCVDGGGWRTRRERSRWPVGIVKARRVETARVEQAQVP